MAARSAAARRAAICFACLLALTACTSGGDAEPSVPPVSTTEPAVATTTTTGPVTTTTVGRTVLTLTDYLVAVIEAATATGVTEAAGAVLEAPSEDASRDLAAALEQHISMLEVLQPPDEASEFHGKLLAGQQAWLTWYEDLADALRDGDQDTLVSLQAESQTLTFAEIETGELQRQLVGLALSGRDDPLSRYVLEASVVAARFAIDAQDVLLEMQLLLAAGEENFEGLLALLDEEAALFGSARNMWGALSPSAPALEYHLMQGHLMASAAAGLEGMSAAIRAENVDLFQRSFQGLLEGASGAIEVGVLQSEMLLTALIGEPADGSDEAQWTWIRVPDQGVISGDFRSPALITAATAGGPGFVAVGNTVLTSEDGITWQGLLDEGPFDDAGLLSDVGAGGPGFVALGTAYQDDSDVPAVWTSSDGTSWERVPHRDAVFGGSERLFLRTLGRVGSSFVAFGVEGDVASGDFGVASWFSPDGVSWSRVALDADFFGQDVVLSVVPGGPGVVAFGTALWTSSDGRSWDRFEYGEVLGGLESHLNDVVATDSGLVAVGADGSGGDRDAAIWTSFDGRTWTRVTHDETMFGGAGDQLASHVVAGDFGLLAIGRTDSPSRPVFWTSEDGSSWAAIEGPAMGPDESWGVREAVVGPTGVLVVATNATEFTNAMWLGIPYRDPAQEPLDVRGVWHRDNNGESHEMLVCFGPDEALECAFFANTDASPSGRGQFVGSLQGGCDVFDTAACENAAAMVQGQMLMQDATGMVIGTITEQIVLNEDGSMTLVWVDVGEDWSGGAPVPFHCPWYRTWSEAQANPSDCVFGNQ